MDAETVRPSAPPALPDGDLWVFGYGSLMWKPGFAYVEVRPARIYGYHRALCVWSWVYRGTESNPGLVAGLDAGGSCVGRAFRVARAHTDSTAQYLFAREMVTEVYIPVMVPLCLNDGSKVEALAFVVDRRHPQYAGKLSAEEAAATVRRAHGKGGANSDYIANTVAHLDKLGIAESLLHEVHALLNAAQ